MRASSPRRCELVADGDRVGRLAAAVEVDDRVEDDLVDRTVEVDAAEHLADVGDGVLGEQHRAEHALLGGVVLRRRAVARTARALTRLVRRGAVTPVVARRLGQARHVPRPLLGDAHAVAPPRCSSTPHAVDGCDRSDARGEHRHRRTPWVRPRLAPRSDPSYRRCCVPRSPCQRVNLGAFRSPRTARCPQGLGITSRDVDDTPGPVVRPVDNVWTSGSVRPPAPL